MDGIRGANMAGQTDAMYQVIFSTNRHIFLILQSSIQGPPTQIEAIQTNIFS